VAVSISQGTNNKPVASEELVKLFSKLMSIVHRDVSEAELNQRNSKDKNFAEFIESIKSGELDEEKIAELKESLGLSR
jgi:hypothetical protein